MPQLSNQDRAMIIGQLLRDAFAREVAVALNVNRRTVNRLKAKFEKKKQTTLRIGPEMVVLGQPRHIRIDG